MPEHRSDLQEGLGQTGRFGEFFIALGALIALFGLLVIAVAFSWLELPFFSAIGSVDDSLIAGFLFLIEGVGFILFGVLAVMSGWARHHPGWEGDE